MRSKAWDHDSSGRSDRGCSVGGVGHGKDLQDNHHTDGASRHLADRVDGLFTAAVKNLQGVAPHFKVATFPTTCGSSAQLSLGVLFYPFRQ